MSPDILAIALEELNRNGYVFVPSRQDAEEIAKAVSDKVVIKTVYKLIKPIPYQEVESYDTPGTSCSTARLSRIRRGIER